MADTFTITRIIAADELAKHAKRFVGITVTAPTLKTIGSGTGLEYVCDVRVGTAASWGLIKDVIVSQWTVGVVTDMNVPVLCERSEAGQVTIIARSVVRLPDISATTYSYADLGLTFMLGLVADESGVYRDGFGHAMADPTLDTGEHTDYTWSVGLIPWGDPEFSWGVTEWGATRADAGWAET